MKNLVLIFTLFIGVASFASERPDYGMWTKLLEKHVSSSGDVDYPGIKKEMDYFNKVLVEFRNKAPKSDWSDQERKAYYINVYNAYTIKFILTDYPVSSPKKVRFSGKDMWHFKMVQVGPQRYTLDFIENGLLRKMNDPRIHFAINCGAQSCPKLLNEAYVPSKLNSQLTKVTKQFIRNDKHNEIKEKKIKISKIFEWYADDFNQGDLTLIKFLNKYSDVTINKDAKVEYLEYDWSLNE